MCPSPRLCVRWAHGARRDYSARRDAKTQRKGAPQQDSCKHEASPASCSRRPRLLDWGAACGGRGRPPHDAEKGGASAPPLCTIGLSRVKKDLVSRGKLVDFFSRIQFLTTGIGNYQPDCVGVSVSCAKLVQSISPAAADKRGLRVQYILPG